MKEKVQEAHDILSYATEKYQPSHTFALFSGGDDSVTSLMVSYLGGYLDGAVHINTGIGVEETREFVRETVHRTKLPYLEYEPDDKTYDELVLEKGFPHGPKSHNTMYYYLKQRQVRRLVRDHKTHHKDRIGLVTGIRKSESRRRMNSQMTEPVFRVGAQLWINPVLNWTKADCLEFLEANNIPRNEVSRLLHRSGECLYGAFANPEEI